MSVKSGNNIDNNGLVFGIDTGYGQTDKDSPGASYKGMPTTNYITDADKMEGWSSYSNGNDGTFTTEFGTTGYTMKHRASWNGLFKDFTLPSTGTYTFSAYYRYRGGTSDNNGATVYVSGYGAGDTATSINKGLLNEWQRVEKTVNVTDVTVRFYIISYGGTNAWSSWDVTMPQIEKVGTRTAFTPNTRSNTEALLDIANRTTLTLNTSYNADQTVYFDGADDYIDLDINPQLGNRAASWEFVVNFGAVHDNETSIYRQIYIQEASIWIAQYYDYIGIDIRKDNDAWYDGNGGTNTNSQIGPVSSSTWYHGVFTWDGSSVRGYLNGSLQFTYAVSGLTYIRNGTAPRRLGRRSSQPLLGQLPVFRAYNRALSADEISDNFKIYQQRFNI